MGSDSCLLCLVLFISISSFIYSSHLMDAAWHMQQPAEERASRTGTASLGVHLAFSHYDEEDANTEKKDNVRGDIRFLMLEKFRILLGLSGSGDGNSHKLRHGFSPAPAPLEEAAAPAPVPSLHRNLHHAGFRSPWHHPHPAPPVQDLEVRRRNGSKSSFRRIVVSAVVSAGAMLLFVSLTVAFICCRFRRKRKLRPGKTMPASGVGGRIVGSKNSNPSNSIGTKCVHPAEEIYQLSSMRPFFQGAYSSPKLNKLSDEDASNSPSHITELMEDELGSTSSSYDEGIHQVEPKCSDDESFHSVCNSCHSSTASFSEGSHSSDHSQRTITQLSPPKSPIQVMSTPTASNSQELPSHSLYSIRRETFTDPSDNRQSSFSIPLPPYATLQTDSIHPTTSISSSNFRRSQSPFTPENSKIPATMEEKNSTSTSIESVSTTKKTQHEPTTESLPSPSVIKPLRSLSKTSVSVGQIPKPPRTPPSTEPPPCKELDSSQCTSQSSSSPPASNGNVTKPPAPPPLPPQFIKAGKPGQPPPPPPCLLHSYAPIGKDGAPLPKLKPLHWDKVRAAPDRSMVWDKLRSSSFELDEDMIESLFGYNLQSSTKKEEEKSKSSSPSKHVIEPKRLQNITILLKALNATAEQVCNCLLQGNGLGAQQLEALAKMVPTKEEENKLINYEGDVNELGSAEKFVKAILSIPFSFARIEVMLYRETFEDEVVHLRKSFGMLEEACQELRSSRLFLKLLEAVLKTGNRMNVGTIRGGAKAFKLDALLKLADVKGTDGKTTLLHFVVQEVIRSEGIGAMEMTTHKRNSKTTPKTLEEKEQNNRVLMGLELVSGLSNELCNVKKTASIDLDVLANSVSNLSNGMDRLKHLIQHDLLTSTDDRDRSFMCLMTSFLSQVKRRIKELKEDEDRVLFHVREITEYFHGDVSKDKANPLQIFVTVRDFLGMLDRVCKEIRSSKTHHSPNHTIPFRYT